MYTNESLSPTQQRGESKLSGGIIHETITDAEGKDHKVKIHYILASGVCVCINYTVLGEHSIPASHLIEILQEIIEKAEGHTLIFQ